jgi:hypothetical protein
MKKSVYDLRETKERNYLFLLEMIIRARDFCERQGGDAGDPNEAYKDYSQYMREDFKKNDDYFPNHIFFMALGTAQLRLRSFDDMVFHKKDNSFLVELSKYPSAISWLVHDIQQLRYMKRKSFLANRGSYFLKQNHSLDGIEEATEPFDYEAIDNKEEDFKQYLISDEVPQVLMTWQSFKKFVVPVVIGTDAVVSYREENNGWWKIEVKHNAPTGKTNIRIEDKAKFERSASRENIEHNREVLDGATDLWNKKIELQKELGYPYSESYEEYIRFLETRFSRLVLDLPKIDIKISMKFEDIINILIPSIRSKV